MNWYMNKMLVTDHQHTLLADAEVHRLRQLARRPRWALRRTVERPAERAHERSVERPAARRAAAVTGTPTWH